MSIDKNRTGRYRLRFPKLVGGVDTRTEAVLDSYALGSAGELISISLHTQVELQAEEYINHMDDTGWKTIKTWGASGQGG